MNSRLIFSLLVLALIGCSTGGLADRGIESAGSSIHRTCLANTTPDEPVPRFRLLGEVRWDVDTQYGGVPVGGLSSIEWDATHNEYLLVSDDRSVHGPARFYTAQMRYDATGLHDVWLTDMRMLRAPSGRPYQDLRHASADAAVPDAEALRVVPGSGHLLWSSEGDFSRGFGPEINEIGRDGQWLARWPLPPSLQLPVDPPETAVKGPRRDFTIEGMSFSADGRTLWLSMEGALQQDGPMPSPGHAGAPVRITALDARSRAPLRQIAYQPDALPDDIGPLAHRAINGVSDILQDGPDHLLVLERAFLVLQGWRARLYRIHLHDDANGPLTDTLHLPQLVPGHYRAATKQLVLDLADAGLRSVDNVEGMTWGPPLPTGERALLLVSDNNFNPAEVTQFIALAQMRPCNAE